MSRAKDSKNSKAFAALSRTTTANSGKSGKRSKVSPLQECRSSSWATRNHLVGLARATAETHGARLSLTEESTDLGKNPKRAVLLELLNKVTSKLPSGKAQGVYALSDESKRSFTKFMRGYANVVRVASRNAAAAEDGSLVEQLEEAAAADDPARHRPHTAGTDHYEYFGRRYVQTDRHTSSEDNDKRLKAQRDGHKRIRSVLGGLDSEPKSNWMKKNVASRVNSLGQPTEHFLNSLVPNGEEQEGQAPSGDRQRPSSRQRASVNKGSQDKGQETEGRSRIAAMAAKAQKEEIRTREACESLRFLVFGTVSTDGSKRGKDKDGRSVNFYEQKCGTKEEVMQLHKIWNQMDEDGSGDVEFQEFLIFFSRSKADRLLGMRCVKYLVGKCHEDCDEDATPGGCRIEDMMRLIWLKAEKDDLIKMMNWFKEAEYEKDSVPAPQLLPEKKRRQIMDNFELSFDETGCGRIQWTDLQDTGLMDGAMVRDLREKYGAESSVFVGQDAVLEILCPNGYRAHAGVTSVVDKEGNLLVKVENELFSGWLRADNSILVKNKEETG